MEQYFNSLDNKSNSLESYSCIFFRIILSSDKINFFTFRLADDQKSFNAACNNLCIFEQPLWISLSYNKQEFPLAKYHLCWTSILNKNISLFVKFTAKQVLKSFSGRNNSMEPHVFGFSKSLHMVWKNEES